MLCWLKPHSHSRLTSQAMQTKMSTQASPFPNVCAPASGYNNSIYLFVNGQQISWHAWLSFSSPANAIVLHFLILFCWGTHVPFPITDWIKNLSNFTFSEELSFDLSSGLRHMKIQGKREQWSESQGQWCSAASTPPQNDLSIIP